MKKFIIVTVFFLVLFINGCMSMRNFEITYELNGGEFSVSEEMISSVKGNGFLLEPTVTKQGYDLVGWYTDASFTNEYDFDNPVQQDLTLYVKWQIQEYLVTFYTEEEYEQLTIEYGSSIPIPDEPDKEGYVFEGWYYDEECTEPISETDLIIETTDVYANWEAIDYTVTYYVDGEVLLQEVYHYGESVDILSDYQAEGKRYLGTYLSDDYLVVAEDDLTMPSHDISLYIQVENALTTLRLLFPPMRDPSMLDILPSFGTVLVEILNAMGYTEITTVEILVSASYDDAVEALLSGQADVLFGTASMYVEAKDNEIGVPIELLASTTMQGYNKTLLEAYEWNDGLASIIDESLYLPFYQSLIIAGITPEARALADKVNAQTTLVWEDFENLDWCVTSVTSTSGYIYPNMWLYNQFGYRFEDISWNIHYSGGYSDVIAGLAYGNCDIGAVFSDARAYYENDWTSSYGRPNNIWEETDVIAIAGYIMRDAIFANTTNFNDGFTAHLQEALIAASEDPIGFDAISFLSTGSFTITTDEDYDATRELNDFLIE